MKPLINTCHALRAFYVLLLIALSLACGARTVNNNKTKKIEREEAATPSFATLNGLAVCTVVTVEDILRTFGEPDSVVLLVSRVDDGDIYSGLVLERSFRKDGFEDFRKLSVPANKDYYHVRFHYADSWLRIATPDITEMTKDGGVPGDMSFADFFEFDGFSFCDSNWVLGTEKGSVTIGSSLEELKKLSLYMVPKNNVFYFALSVLDDSLWFADVNDGKITVLSFEGISWI